MKPLMMALAAALAAGTAYLWLSYQPDSRPYPPKRERKPAPQKKEPVALVQPVRAEKTNDEEDKASIWMKGKLQLSQNILAGLTRSDFGKIKANARAMNSLGFLEKWSRADRKDYKRQLAHFELANLEIMRQAEKKNLDGATLAYLQLTTSCVQCHQVVRGVQK